MELRGLLQLLRRRPTRLFSRRKAVFAAGLVLILLSVGTIGYSVIEGWSALDAFYMTVITMTTIGFGEIRPLSPYGRVFTLGLILSSVVTAGYAISQITGFLFEGELEEVLSNRKMEKRIKQLNDHIILCGCGSTGIHIAEELHRTRTPFLFIETDERQIMHVQETIGDVPYLQGDATSDSLLERAGIECARGLIAAVHSDKDNVFIVLTARYLNPKLRIVSRVMEDENVEKLRRAGADDIIAPNAIGGRRMAAVMLRPTAVSLMDELMLSHAHNVQVDEVSVSELPGLIGLTLAQANIGQRTGGLLVVAIIEVNQGYVFNPRADTLLEPGDKLIIMGTGEQRAALRRLF